MRVLKIFSGSIEGEVSCASKGPAFPSPLALDGYPTSPADYAGKQRSYPEKSQVTPEKIDLIWGSANMGS